MKKLIYLIVVIAALALIVAGCIPVVPPTEQSEPTSLTKGPTKFYVATTGSDDYGDGTETWVDNSPTGWGPEDTGPWATISRAISKVSPYDTIIVAAGTYIPEETIVIKVNNLTLIGPQANIDPRPFYSSKRKPGSELEAIIDGKNGFDNIILIAADFVVINGFEVRFGKGDLIKQEERHIGTVVKYNIVHDSVTDEGIQLKNCSKGVIEYNYVYNTAGDALNFAYSEYCTIQFNEAHDADDRTSDTFGGAIYTYHSGGIDIIGNLIYHTYSHGIVYGGTVRSYDTYTFDSPNKEGKVEGNIVHDVKGDGLVLLSYYTIVEDNEIYGCHRGIQIIGEGIVVQNNNLYKNVVGISVIDIEINSTNISAHCNNIEGNIKYGIINEAKEIVDATHNWWGHATGPSPKGEGDRVSENVIYDNWAYIPDFCDCEVKSKGYWKNHPDYVDGILEVFDYKMEVGTDKIVYDLDYAMNIFAKPKSTTYSMLAAQLLAAKLNVAQLRQFNPDYEFDCVNNAIGEADAILEIYEYNEKFATKLTKAEANSIKDVLDYFNNDGCGDYGCPCECY